MLIHVVHFSGIVYSFGDQVFGKIYNNINKKYVFHYMCLYADHCPTFFRNCLFRVLGDQLLKKAIYCINKKYVSHVSGIIYFKPLGSSFWKKSYFTIWTRSMYFIICVCILIVVSHFSGTVYFEPWVTSWKGMAVTTWSTAWTWPSTCWTTGRISSPSWKTTSPLRGTVSTMVLA